MQNTPGAIPRFIDSLIIHCSATQPDPQVDAELIRHWHVNERGWKDIGYHFVIPTSGAVQKGRPLEMAGAHARGFNANSIGICLVGGLEKSAAGWHSAFNYTDEQLKALWQLIQTLRLAFPAVEAVIGHRDTGAQKDCPCFDVRTFMSGGYMAFGHNTPGKDGALRLLRNQLAETAVNPEMECVL